MKRVGAREFKNRQSQYLRRVQRGERILVTVRGKPLARVLPPDDWDSLSHEEKLEELVRQGHIRKARGRGLRPFKPVPLRGKPLSQTIIEDRGK